MQGVKIDYCSGDLFTSENIFEDFFLFIYQEIDEMISTVDKNGDGKISFSEFRSEIPCWSQ